MKLEKQSAEGQKPQTPLEKAMTAWEQASAVWELLQEHPEAPGFTEVHEAVQRTFGEMLEAKAAEARQNKRN